MCLLKIHLSSTFHSKFILFVTSIFLFQFTFLSFFLQKHCANIFPFSLLYYRREDEIRRRMKRPETTSSTMASFSSNSEDGSIRDHGGSSNSVNQFPPFSIILEESSSTSSNFSSKPIHQFNFSVLLLWLMMIVMFWSLEIYYI